jgi:Sigma-70, region 4/SnoaL-like domain
VALAFVAALQRLTARQRAVLLLRDVLDWKASEVAGLLGTSVPAVNSALQRARAGLGRAAPPADSSTRSLSRQDRVVLDRFMGAWQRRDIDGLVGLLREDAVPHMPPQALRYVGREQIAGFLRTVPAEGRLDRIRLVATRVNGQPAVAAYLPSDGGLGCLRRDGADGGGRGDPGHHRLSGSLAVCGVRPAPDLSSMRVLRLPSTIGSMLAHIRLTSSTAAGSRAWKLDSQTIIAPCGVGSTAKRPRLSVTGRPPLMVYR